jgi:hypothetical protein
VNPPPSGITDQRLRSGVNPPGLFLLRNVAILCCHPAIGEVSFIGSPDHE